MVWYYVKDGARQGPVEEEEFNKLVGQGEVRGETLVWCEGMSEWRPYSAVAPAAPPTPEPAPPVVEARPEPQVAAEPVLQAVAAPVVAMAAAPAEVQPDAARAAIQPHFCTQCGRQFPSEELVRFGTATVCGNCKEIYAQRLRETGQVAGRRIYAGFWIRFVAVFIDGIALGIVNFAIQTILNVRVTNPDVNHLGVLMGAIGLSFTVSLLLSMLYECFFLVQFGATPGKMIFKLKVITAEGGGITWGRAIGRHFAKYLSGITLLIGYIMAGFDSEKRALHDYIAGTRVIRTA
jgi:uncharacterized RDD family membrane protein YckC